MPLKLSSEDIKDSASIPLQLLAFIASNEARFERFVALSGMGLENFRKHAQDPVFQAFVLDYALQDQSMILEFAAHQGLAPEAVLRARRRLPGFVPD